MASLDDCHVNEPENSYPIESLRLPLDNSMRVVFTGYFNGLCVEVRSLDEISLLYHMGCFGKGSISRSKPTQTQGEDSVTIMRKRQYIKRSYWHKKFSQLSEPDDFLNEIEELSAKITKDCQSRLRKDVIDLVSSDEDLSDTTNNVSTPLETNIAQTDETGDMVVIVPNSDSEDDNYFVNLKPKCCLNRIHMQEKLILTLQEAFFLLYGLGSLQIISCEDKLLNIQECWDLFVEMERYFIQKYVVYHYFRSKGYIVKPGIKFGGDYLLYPEGPGISHADYIVVIRSEGQIDWISVLGHVRMATTTVKDIILVEVVEPTILPRLPQGLGDYKVQELLLSRKIPVTINDDD